jgi:hypothetical protein
MNNYFDEENGTNLYDGMAILLPDNTIISGDYDGYGTITTEDGEAHDIYEVVARLMFGIADRDLVFSKTKTFSMGDKDCFTLEKHNHAKPILIDDVKEVAEGFDINYIIGKSMNDVNDLGFNKRTDFDDANDMIKVMHRGEVKDGMKYDDFDVSEGAEGQGFWVSSYETRVVVDEY